MARAAPLVVAAAFLLLPGCGGGEATGETPQNAETPEAAAETAFDKNYRDAWVAACKAAVADIRKRDAKKRSAHVKCARPVQQMEGNTSFEPDVAAQEGRDQGRFDGCAYAWDEVYRSAGEVEPRC